MRITFSYSQQNKLPLTALREMFNVRGAGESAIVSGCTHGNLSLTMPLKTGLKTAFYCFHRCDLSIVLMIVYFNPRETRVILVLRCRGEEYILDK